MGALKLGHPPSRPAVTLSILYRPQLAPLLDSPNYASTKQQEKGLVVSIMTEMTVQCSRAYPVIPALYLTRPFSLTKQPPSKARVDDGLFIGCLNL